MAGGRVYVAGGASACGNAAEYAVIQPDGTLGPWLETSALNLMRFFEHESCGQCTPCRVGTAKAAALMEAPRWDAGLLEELRRIGRAGSMLSGGLDMLGPTLIEHGSDYVKILVYPK